MAGMIQQDSFTDFYPWYVQGYNAYVPLMTDASPQAALIPPTNGGGRKLLSFPGASAGAAPAGGMSTVLWSLGLVAAALVLMHVAAGA